MTERYGPETQISKEYKSDLYDRIEGALYEAADRLWTPYDNKSFSYLYSAAARHQLITLPNIWDEDAADLIVAMSGMTNRMVDALTTTLPGVVLMDTAIFQVYHPQHEANVKGNMMHYPKAGEPDSTCTLSYEQFLAIMYDGGVCDFIPPAQRLARRTLNFLEELNRTQRNMQALQHPFPILEDKSIR